MHKIRIENQLNIHRIKVKKKNKQTKTNYFFVAHTMSTNYNAIHKINLHIIIFARIRSIEIGHMRTQM